MPLPLTCQSNTNNLWTESHQASPWASTGPGRDLPLLYAFADDTHLPDNEIINLIFFSNLVVNISVPSDMCRIFGNPSLPICYLHPDFAARAMEKFCSEDCHALHGLPSTATSLRFSCFGSQNCQTRGDFVSSREKLQ